MKPQLTIALLCALATSSHAAPLVGETLPIIELANARGQTKSAWQSGRVTVVSFVAFWCDTWKTQSQRLDSARAELRGLPIDWTFISVDGRWSGLANRGKWSDIARGALLDSGSVWTHKLEVSSVPYTLVVDGQGKIRYAAQGIARGAQLRPAISAALSNQAPQNGVLHLAFDDFPSRNPKMDDELLDILRARKIKVSFYGDPARLKNSPAIVARARREGHQIHGVFSSKNKSVVDPFDFKAPGENEILRRTSGAVAANKTLLLRVGVRQTLNVLPRLLDSFQARGLDVGA